MERSSYEEKKRKMEEFNKQNDRKKRGLSIMPLKFAPSFFAAFPFQVLESVFINNARGCSLKTAFSENYAQNHIDNPNLVV